MPEAKQEGARRLGPGKDVLDGLHTQQTFLREMLQSARDQNPIRECPQVRPAHGPARSATQPVLRRVGTLHVRSSVPRHPYYSRVDGLPEKKAARDAQVSFSVQYSMIS